MTATDTLESAGPASAAAPNTAARDRIVIGVLLVSTFVVILNETIMSVAIPHLMADLGVTAAAAQWLTAAFLLTMAVVIPVTGYLIQRFNTRPLYTTAMSLFSAGTLICAVAPGLGLLLFGRVIQACGTAIMFPLLMTTVMNLVAPANRGKVMGNISIVISVAPAIGPALSGLILNYLGWRWMFIIVLPIALLALAIGGRLMKNVTEPRSAPLDILSVVLSAIAFGGVVYGLSTVGEMSGETPPAVPGWIPLAIGLVTAGIFIHRQLRLQKNDKALLDLRTFQSRNFTICIVLMAVFMMCLFGTIILLPIYTQGVMGIDAQMTGLLLLPGGLIMGILGRMSGSWYDRWGPTVLLVPGSIVVSAVLWALTLVDQNTSIWAILTGHIIISVGLALIFTPLFTASLSSVRPQLYSYGSATLGSLQQVAGAAGVALFVAIMTLRSTALVEQGVEQVPALSAGIRAGFMCGAIISVFAVAAAFFVRKPEDNGMDMHGGH